VHLELTLGLLPLPARCSEFWQPLLLLKVNFLLVSIAGLATNTAKPTCVSRNIAAIVCFFEVLDLVIAIDRVDLNRVENRSQKF
jgi:hypothetical protein